MKKYSGHRPAWSAPVLRSGTSLGITCCRKAVSESSLLSHILEMMMHFKRVDRFCKFTKKELRRYPRCHEVHMRFRECYGLERFNSKEIDRHLWQAGRECFGKRR